MGRLDRIVTGRWLSRWAAYGVAWALPLSAYWAIGPAGAPGWALLYARPGVYPSDLALAALLAITLLQSGGHYRASSELARGGRGTGGRRTGLTGLPRRLWTSALGAARAGDSTQDQVARLLGALVALGFLTAPAALSRAVGAYTALRWLFALGTYLLLTRATAPTEAFVSALVVGLAAHTGVGIGQVIKQGPVGLPGELALEAHQLGAAVLEVGGRPWLRPYGLTFHPNVLGGYLAVGLLLLLPLLDRRWAQPLWWLLAGGLLLTFSRSAWLATAMVLPPVAGWLAWRQSKLRRPLAITLGGAVLVATVIAALLTGQLVSRFRPWATKTEYRSLAERGELIGLALEMMTERPLTGVGAGNFALSVSGSDARFDPHPVHNVPLLMASEVGLMGGIVWCVLWLAPGIAAANWLQDDRVWPIVLAAAWFAWGVIGLWDHYPWGLNTGRLLSVSLLGLMTRAWEEALPGR